MLERIRDKDRTDIYTKMLEKCETEISSIEQQIYEIKDFDATIRKRKTEMKQNIDLIDEIVSAGGISNTHLRMLVDEVTISEKDNKQQISIGLKAMFRRHMDFYNEKGEISERIFEGWYYPAW